MTLNRPSTSAWLSADVGSSMISTRTSWVSALAISTTCCSPTRRLLTVSSGSMSWPRRCSSSRARARSALRSIDAAARELLGEEQVVQHGQVGAEVELLEDDAHPVLGGHRDARQLDRLGRPRAPGPPVGCSTPARTFISVGLAGAVLAHEDVDLARVHIEGHVVEGRGAREDLGHVLRAQGHAARPRRRARRP